ncbi:MAG TPA: NAD(P)/FAD-dependent oxidoreductase [Candidatus Bathyarchaeia archaeon]|nr:NAD(P)/FAD-dependent oxidoreductase [Candidatus Bathyarchaeia archaeon]
MEYDVVVVGAGPAGSMAAKYAAKAGASVLMIEEHETIGQPVQCAGLISTQAFEGCEVSPETVSRLAVRGANVHAPDGHVLKIDGRRTMAYVVDRGELDRAMALEALKSGAAALVKTRLNNFRRQQDRIIIAAQSQGDPIEIQTRVIIGADGLQSAVGRLAGLGRAKLVFTCAQAEIFAGAAQTDFVDLYVGRNVAPGFFAWGIPTGSGSVRIGLCSTERSSDLLGPLLERLSPHSAPTFLNFCAGGIPLGPPPCTVADGILLVGDAAGQVKATSGGGIYPGTLCAKIAGAVAAEAAAHTNTTRGALMAYDRRWRSAIGRELETGLRIRTRLNALGDDDLNYMVRTLDDERTLDIISRYGDMDHPSVVLRKLLLSTKAPRLLKLIKPMIKFGVTRTAR